MIWKRKKYEKNNGYGWICKIVKNNALNALKKENKYIKNGAKYEMFD